MGLPPSFDDEEREIKRELDELRQATRYQQSFSNLDEAGFGAGAKSRDQSTAFGTTAMYVEFHQLTEDDEDGVATGTFDKIVLEAPGAIVDNDQSITDQELRFIFDSQAFHNGQFISLRPKAGKTLTVKAGGNIDVSGDIIIGEGEFLLLIYYEDSGVTGDGGYVPMLFDGSISGGGSGVTFPILYPKEDLGTTNGVIDLALNQSDGHYKQITLDGDASLTFSSLPPSTNGFKFYVLTIQDGTGGHVYTDLPNSVINEGTLLGQLQTDPNAQTLWQFSTGDGGGSWHSQAINPQGSGGDNLGNHKADQNLEMSPDGGITIFDINRVRNLDFDDPNSTIFGIKRIEFFDAFSLPIGARNVISSDIEGMDHDLPNLNAFRINIRDGADVLQKEFEVKQGRIDLFNKNLFNFIGWLGNAGQGFAVDSFPNPSMTWALDALGEYSFIVNAFPRFQIFENQLSLGADGVFVGGSTKLSMGNRFIQFTSSSDPGASAPTERFLFQNIADNHLSIRTDTGIIDVEQSILGSLNRDLSNLISPTIPNIDISMEDQFGFKHDINKLRNLDFDDPNSSIFGVKTVQFFDNFNTPTDNTNIASIADGLEFHLIQSGGIQYKFFFGTGLKVQIFETQTSFSHDVALVGANPSDSILKIGSHWIDFTQVSSANVDPAPVGSRFLYSNSFNGGNLTVRTPTGDVDLETVSGITESTDPVNWTGQHHFGNLVHFDSAIATSIVPQVDDQGLGQDIQRWNVWVNRFIDFDDNGVPTTPGSGEGRIFYDNSVKEFKQVDDGGTVTGLGGGVKESDDPVFWTGQHHFGNLVHFDSASATDFVPQIDGKNLGQDIQRWNVWVHQFIDMDDAGIPSTPTAGEGRIFYDDVVREFQQRDDTGAIKSLVASTGVTEAQDPVNWTGQHHFGNLVHFDSSIATDIIPQTDGKNLGQDVQRWNVWVNQFIDFDDQGDPPTPTFGEGRLFWDQGDEEFKQKNDGGVVTSLVSAGGGEVFTWSNDHDADGHNLILDQDGDSLLRNSRDVGDDIVRMETGGVARMQWDNSQVLINTVPLNMNGGEIFNIQKLDFATSGFTASIEEISGVFDKLVYNVVGGSDTFHSFTHDGNVVMEVVNNGVALTGSGTFEKMFRANDSTEIGFSVASNAFNVGSLGSMRIPYTTSTTTSNATLDGLFGNENGCIGIASGNSAFPRIMVRTAGTWKSVFVS